MRPIPWQARHQLGVFSFEQALATGWSADQLDRAVRSARLVRLRRGAFALAATEESGYALERLRLGQRGIAAALRIPTATVSHASAVAVHGLPLLRAPEHACVTLPPELRTREAGLHVHRQPIPTWQLDAGQDISTTSVARSCIDLAREGGLDAGLVAADAAIHDGLCTLTELDAVYATCRGRAGLPSGRQLLELADGRSESPLESISRLGMTSLRPAPRPQVSLYTPTGLFLGRVDFYWSEFGVVGEADGQQKYSDDELWKEKLRQERLTDQGLVVERWGWSVARKPAMLQAKLEQAFRRASLLRSAGIPATAVSVP